MLSVIIKPEMLKIEDYSYHLPEDLIAQKPASPRDSARLLVYNLADKSIADDHFYNLNQYLKTNSALVVNNTRVKKARLKFNGIEIFILEELKDGEIWALIFPGKKFKLGSKLKLSSDIEVEVLEINSGGHRRLKFNQSLSSNLFDEFRRTPLPPYINQDESLSGEYQTVFSKKEGDSLAAPTAGLHFTDKLIEDLSLTHQFVKVDLTVGLGTFASINESNIKLKKLHSESWHIEDDQLIKLKSVEHITAVGTTSVRTLESSGAEFKLNEGNTEIFIQPGYKFSNVDSLITNFHLPKTSLLMLVAALIADKLSLSEPEARKELMRIYAHAIKQKYRFFSFGDAMLIV
jgi:S-adenosylmethionine:tRNA ribosyltransferase-isomerase